MSDIKKKMKNNVIKEMATFITVEYANLKALRKRLDNNTNNATEKNKQDADVCLNKNNNTDTIIRKNARYLR